MEYLTSMWKITKCCRLSKEYIDNSNILLISIVARFSFLSRKLRIFIYLSESNMKIFPSVNPGSVLGFYSFYSDNTDDLLHWHLQCILANSLHWSCKTSWQSLPTCWCLTGSSGGREGSGSNWWSHRVCKWKSYISYWKYTVLTPT